jgi:glutamyl-tRNA synthetase
MVRVRIAPSPTGDPHVGLAYMTLFNYVFAKKNGGKLILRIEDTDQVRSKASSDELIMSSLKWLGLKWDEGPDCGGSVGPYRQSERTAIYREHAELLLQSGAAYRCFCTQERLEEARAKEKASGRVPRYDGFCETLSQDDIAHNLRQALPHVVRLKMPRTGSVAFKDFLRGDITIDAAQCDDQVLMKSDGYPTYHLANVVDDHLMGITHVIRAEEWISSVPKHVVLYEAFGWDKPVFVHMPLLRNKDRSKISKRKNPVSLNYYRRKGILPHAMINFLALMGWSMGDNREIFSLDEMIQRFDLSQVTLGAPIFDLVKLGTINQHYIQAMGPDEFADHLREEVFSKDYLKTLYPHVKARLQSFEEFCDKNSFFFNGALEYQVPTLLPKTRSAQELLSMVTNLLEKLDDLYTWDKDHIHSLMESHREALGWKPQDYFMPIRMIVTGRRDSPPLAESLELVGREMVRFRMRDALEKLSERL